MTRVAAATGARPGTKTGDAVSGRKAISRQRIRTAAWVAAAALAAVPCAAQAQKLYKWTDENGVVHYTDKAPDATRGGTQLDKQGRPMRKIEPAPTAEQLRVREAELERQKVLEKEREIVERRDKALLSSYTTESEIDLARARAVTTVESQIASAQAYLTQLTKRRSDIEGRKRAFKDKPLPPALERDSENVEAEYAKNSDLVAQKQRDLVTITARYDADKTRWRELKAIQEANAAAAAASNRPGTAPAAPAPTAAPRK